MDRENLSELRRLAPGDAEREKMRLLREFDPASAGAPAGRDGEQLDVPDPYYGGFDEVFDLVQAACEGLLDQIRAGEVP
jgi:protein-tyrosine phosphatase